MRPLLPILLVVAPACGLDEPYGPDAGDSTSQTEQAIASEMGRFEVAIDVPWRVEPRTYTGTAPIDPAECFDVDCTVRYPAIPIQITIHDADQVSEPGRPRFGAFRSVQVIETSGNRTFTHSFGIESLREIEFQSDAWPCPDQPGDPAPPGWTPDHRVCKRWENAGCGPEFAWIDDKNEWGTLGYPITDERYYDGGAYQYFDKGAAFWKPSLGTVVLEGAIAKRHLELMRAGFRAFPTVAGTNQARFENGDAIYAKTAAAAYLVKAPMLARLEQNTWLGYPLGDQVTGPDGVVYQRFENGTLFAEGSAPVCVQGGATNLDFITLPDRPAQ